MSAVDLVIHPGDLVRGAGQIVNDADGQWLDTSRVSDMMLRPGPTPRNGSFSVPLVGADRLDGFVTVTGTWDGTALRAPSISPFDPSEGNAVVAKWTDPPCPEPPGGWPRGPNGEEVEDLTFDLQDLETTGTAVTVVTFRPGLDQMVLVVATSDPQRVWDVLGPQLPGRLCVVPSRFDRAELDAVTDHLVERMEPWRIEAVWSETDSLARECVRAELMWVTDDVVDYADSLTPGILALKPYLAPSR